VSDLLDHQVIGDTELFGLEESLKQRRVENPISEDVARTQTALLIHHEGLQELIDDPETESFDLAFLLKWVELKLAERGQVREQREVVREETQSLYQKIRFATILPGHFMKHAGVTYPGVKTKIKQSFDIQVTHVTQYQYTKVMGKNPSNFKNGEHATQFVLDREAIQLQPDNPVEQVSCLDAEKFIKKLNLLAKKKDPQLKELIPDHQDGDLYDLPTKGQLMFVACNRGQGNYDLNESQLEEYAWFARNSDKKTHPVAQLKPWVIDGQEIFDLTGNVGVWTKKSSRGYRDAFGSSWRSTSGGESVIPISSGPHASIGFRLVRIREQAK
jgi:formylglycine-generating enzyme required for sulfatase activity